MMTSDNLDQDHSDMKIHWRQDSENDSS